MRQPDWRSWLLEEPEREAAQALFLLHPEWESFAERSETGGLALTFPALQIDGGPLSLTCSGGELRVSWAEWSGSIPISEAHEAMRLLEGVLADRVVVEASWKGEVVVEAKLVVRSGLPIRAHDHRRAESGVLSSLPTTRRTGRSWSGGLDFVEQLS